MAGNSSQPPFRYAHDAIPDPNFDQYKDLESPFASVETLAGPAMREIASQLPVSFPYLASAVSSVVISQQPIKVRDGAELDLRIYKNTDLGKKAILFFVTHGGGWVLGDHDAEEAMNRLVAKRTSSVVVSVSYRLAPEYPYPYAVNDSFDALQWCRKNADHLGIDAHRVIVGGSSSGGNIAAALALKDRDEDINAVIGQVLNIPDTCHPAHFPRDKYEYYSPEQNKDAPVMTTEAARWFWDLYCPTAGHESYASPLLAESHKGLPPALVQVAGHDPVRDDGLAYSEALKKAGSLVKTKVYPGLPHAFYMFPDLEATQTYFNTIMDWINFLDQDLIKIMKFDQK
ncbi:alpha/beta hydrolase fold-domain-containing protein [Aspergillus cavernicola]|uniref:Alpha/beta hydrolase fold-domain-containing protein n=1 Tax=Aspergillus cavernicola TaxID=176166 RepID=A0ABR4IUH4_9EURO